MNSRRQGLLALAVWAAAFGIFAIYVNRSSPVVETKFNHVERVFMHSPGMYTFMVREGNELVVKSYLAETPSRYKIVADVSPEQQMWATVTTGGEAMSGVRIEIHVHSAKDIDGGDYPASKTTNFKTVPIE